MSKAHLEGRQAEGNVMRNEYGVLGGFEETGREVVKKDISKIAKAADKPDFFMGGCGPTVPTGPKRKLRTSWLSKSDDEDDNKPPRVEHVPKPRKKWTPVAKKNLPPRSKSHDGTMAPPGASAAPVRKGRRPLGAAAKKKEEDEKKEEPETKEAAETSTSTSTSTSTTTTTATTASSSKKEDLEKPTPPPKAKAAFPNTASRSVSPPAPSRARTPYKRVQTAPTRARSPAPPKPIADEAESAPTAPAPAPPPSPPKAAPRAASPLRRAGTSPMRQQQQQEPTAKTTKAADWSPDEYSLNVKRPLHVDDAKPIEKEESRASAANLCVGKDMEIESLKKEIERLKVEKGELAKNLKKMKGSATRNVELKDEIFELKQKLKKAETMDENAKKFHKLENKLNTLKLLMDGNVNMNSLEDLQEHVKMLNMIINQDLKQVGMKNIWA